MCGFGLLGYRRADNSTSIVFVRLDIELDALSLRVLTDLLKIAVVDDGPEQNPVLDRTKGDELLRIDRRRFEVVPIRQREIVDPQIKWAFERIPI